MSNKLLTSTGSVFIFFAFLSVLYECLADFFGYTPRSFAGERIELVVFAIGLFLCPVARYCTLRLDTIKNGETGT